MLRKMKDFPFQEFGIEVLPFQRFKGQPGVCMGSVTLLPHKSFPSGKQIGSGNIHEIIDTQLMKPFPGYILLKEALVQSHGTDYFCLYPQLFPNLPQQCVISGFVEPYPTAGEIIVG